MRSIRRFLVVAATTLALTVLAPSASAASPLGDLLLTKTCDAYNHCTVVTSTSGPLVVGTTGTYNGPEFDHRLSSEVVLATPDGGTATGHCTLSYATLLGTCSFARGTGSLAGFHANLTVSSPDGAVFTWAGTYFFGSAD